MRSPSTGSTLWSLAFAIGAFALLTITESFVTAREPARTPRQGVVTASLQSRSQRGEPGADLTVREGVSAGHQRARR